MDNLRTLFKAVASTCRGLRLIDLDGQELIRVNFDGEQCIEVAPPGLQNKADRYCFREALTFSIGEVPVSQLDSAPCLSRPIRVQ